jgi:hypothetical protein
VLYCVILKKIIMIIIIAHNLIVPIDRRYNPSLSIIVTSTETLLVVHAKDFVHGQVHTKQVPIKTRIIGSCL